MTFEFRETKSFGIRREDQFREDCGVVGDGMRGKKTRRPKPPRYRERTCCLEVDARGNFKLAWGVKEAGAIGIRDLLEATSTAQVR